MLSPDILMAYSAMGESAAIACARPLTSAAVASPWSVKLSSLIRLLPQPFWAAFISCSCTVPVCTAMVRPHGLIEMARSLSKPVISPVIRFVAVSIRVILSPRKLVTKSVPPSGERRTPWRGWARPVTTASARPLRVSKTETVLAA